MRGLSDFAAMSGVPQFALITLVIAGKKQVMWVRDLYRGLDQAARHFDIAIVGGETSDTDGPTVVVVSVVGSVEPDRCILRSGGKANDDLFVTGKLGGSIRRRHLNFVARIEEARWLTANFKVHAMMDLSDGLGADLPRLARASRLAFSIDERALPVSRGCTVHRQYPMAKIMNCCLPFRGAIALAWNECGAGNFRNWGSGALATCIKNQRSNIKHSSAVMFISVSAAETEGGRGRALTEKIKVGDVLALVGDLGAGKTQFVKGLARGLGSNEAVTSPTFTLLHEYRGGRLPIYHFDFYRNRKFDGPVGDRI
jgi:ATPase, YjeE family